MPRTLLLLTLLISQMLSSQVVPRWKNYIYQNRGPFLKEYEAFMKIPNLAGDSVNIHRNANFIKSMLEKRGVKAELLTVPAANASPVVFGEVISPGATRTIIFYAHYDGQPVNEKNWYAGLSPFKPQMVTDRLDRGGKFILFPAGNENINDNWRLYGRSSADDKAGVFAIIAAYEAIIRSGSFPAVNIKFFFEGEEEAGSTNLGQVLSTHKNRLAADLWIICDGPRHVSGRKQVVFGVRGDANVEIKVYGATRPLHSGNYGNWAPNPAMHLAKLLSSMKDEAGKVTIDGFYDDVIPLSETERKALKDVPDIERTLQNELKIAKPDGSGIPFLELLSMPSLNINGMQSANVGEMAANIIPSTATAELDLRLVAGNDVKRQIEKLRQHIRKQGYFITDHEPTDEERIKYPLLAKLTEVGTGYNAQRTPMDLPIAQVVIKQIQSTTPDKIVLLPSLGGSLPLYLFEQYLNTRPITITVVNYDNNQHAENENLVLKFLWEGMESLAAVMMGKY